LTFPPKNVSLAECFYASKKYGNGKGSAARYVLEFKQEAVRLVTGGQSAASVARSLGLVDQTLFDWDKASRVGNLKGLDTKVVRADQMEIDCLRTELARVKSLATVQPLMH